MMKSLVVLMIEDEQPDSISARKLVVETAKHNVITAYDAETGLRLLRRFPKVDAILVHASVIDAHENVLSEIKAIDPYVPIILANPFRYAESREASYVLDSHNPQQLLELLITRIPERWRD